MDCYHGLWGKVFKVFTLLLKKKEKKVKSTEVETVKPICIHLARR